jgi:hypothetical protein
MLHSVKCKQHRGQDKASLLLLPVIVVGLLSANTLHIPELCRVAASACGVSMGTGNGPARMQIGAHSLLAPSTRTCQAYTFTTGADNY